MFRSVLFVVALMAANASVAGDASRCPADTVPIQIVDEIWVGNDPAMSAAKIFYPPFRSFVTAITEHVAVRLAEKHSVVHGSSQRCINNAGSKNHSLLQFAAWPIIIDNDRTLGPVQSLESRPTDGCRITSPWIDFYFEQKSVPLVRGVVRWNERQMLADQAVLAGAHNMPTDVTMPLKQSDFLQLTRDYVNSEIRHEPTGKPIEERIPSDILWLFRHSQQSARGHFGFSALSAWNSAVEKRNERYTKLVIALIDRCFASEGADIRYNSILDIGDLISLEQYKIDTLTH